MSRNDRAPRRAPHAGADPGAPVGSTDAVDADVTHPHARSLPEVHASVTIPNAGGWFRRLFAFAGPAYLVSVGYMDPGNWATDLAGGARFGYQLMWVLLMSNLMAVLLQTLSARLGVVTGKDLAQACRDWYPRPLVWPLWILCEIAIVACDLAEVLGAAIGLQLLFGLPLMGGVLITSLDVLLLLAMSRLGMRRMEALIVTLVVTIGGCFATEMLLSHPDLPAVLRGLVPRDETGTLSLVSHSARHGWQVLGLRHESLYVAMGILGATVMPHNLYLHSALVQSRAVGRSIAAKREACKLNLIDSTIALNCAFFVNAAILVLAAAVFHNSGHQDVARLEDAHRLLAPLVGTSLASTLFAVALLASGQSSTITGTLAGQIVMEGFLKWRIQPWLRRIISRGLAIIPAVGFIWLRGPRAVDDLLVLSQVVLSMQLAFAVIPLVTFTSDRAKMGEFVNPRWVMVAATAIAITIVSLNGKLVLEELNVWMAAAGDRAPLLWMTVVPVVAAIVLLLGYLTVFPLLSRFAPRWAWAPGEGDRVDVRPATPREPRRAAALRETIAGHRRIAVALELGPADRAVLEHLRQSVTPGETQLVLLHVAESAASRYLGQEASDQEAREDLSTLESIAETLRALGIPVTTALGFGDVKNELARLVREQDADLLVAGSHGHRLFQDLIHGATTSGLRHRVQCPVLIGPGGRRPPR